MTLPELRIGALEHALTIGATTAAAPTLDTPALRCWLQAQLRACDMRRELRAPELRRGMRALVREARRRHVYPEQAIVIVKQEWSRLTSEAAPVHGVDLPAGGDANGARADLRLDPTLHTRAAALERIVTMLIEEYYG